MSYFYNGKNYKVADSHAHIYPEKIAEKATGSVGDFYDIKMQNPAGTVENLLKSGAGAGVDKYLVCSVATKPEQVMSISSFIAQECGKHEEFVGLGAFHQDVKDAEETVFRIKELGLRGIKIHPDFQRVNIDDERLLALYGILEKEKMPILIHMGDDRYDFSSPERLSKVLDKYPDLICIAAHFGGYRAWDKAERFLPAGNNLWFDTSSSLPFIGKERALDLIGHYGTERMMFGVDFPMWDHKAEIERFLSLDLSDDDNKKILFDNFARLFSLSE
jgi:predicted TIM-barrel fold metal-dependent hydrolase